MIKVGIIGFGKMGKIRAEAVESVGTGEVIAVHDINRGVVPEKYAFAKNAEEIFGNKAIEAVFICTPNHLNKPLTIKGLSSGKHIFCEKPPAFNASGVEEVIEAEKKAGKKLMYGFNHRHHSSIKYIKALVDSGEYGKVLWMRGRYGKSVDAAFFDNWRSKRDLAGGGILLDQGIHMLDLFM